MRMSIWTRAICLPAMVLAMSTVAQAGVVTFGGLSGANEAVFNTYTEGTTTVTPTTVRTWYEAHAFGNPEPSIFGGPISSPSVSSINVTDSATGTFTFNSFDFSSNNGITDYSLQGFLGGSNVFSQAGTQSGAPFGFVTINSSDATQLMDSLSMTFTPHQGTTSFNVDNINLGTGKPVPEPSSAGLLGLGAASLLPLVKRRRR